MPKTKKPVLKRKSKRSKAEESKRRNKITKAKKQATLKKLKPALKHHKDDEAMPSENSTTPTKQQTVETLNNAPGGKPKQKLAGSASANTKNKSKPSKATSARKQLPLKQAGTPRRMRNMPIKKSQSKKQSNKSMPSPSLEIRVDTSNNDTTANNNQDPNGSRIIGITEEESDKRIPARGRDQSHSSLDIAKKLARFDLNADRQMDLMEELQKHLILETTDRALQITLDKSHPNHWYLK